MKLRTVILFITFTLAIASICNSQCLTINLIKNPSLEEYTCIPNNLAMIDCADYWTQPDAESSSDYYNNCAIGSLISQDILPGYQHSYFGNGYAGIICNHYYSPISYREYLQGQLSEPLIRNTCYHVEYWTLLYGGSYSAIDALGIFFSDTLPKKDNSHQLFNFHAQIENPANNVIIDTTNWTKISGDFTAKGGEQFFTVGTFKSQIDINSIYFTPDQADFSVYFFDNFSICPCEDTIAQIEPMAEVVIPNVFTPNKDGSNDEFIVKGQGIEHLNLKVYNRWGGIVYQSDDLKQGWDGKLKNKDCEAGVYFWTAEIVFQNGKHEMRQGTVTLVR